MPTEPEEPVLGPHGRDSPCDNGACTWPRVEASSPVIVLFAVARKLAVLLHLIWVTQEPYIPFYAVAA